MNNKFFETAWNHTNASEQTNWKFNALEIYLTLLDAIQRYKTNNKQINNWLLIDYKLLILNQQDVDQFIICEKYKIHHSYQSNSVSSWYYDSFRWDDILINYRSVDN